MTKADLWNQATMLAFMASRPECEIDGNGLSQEEIFKGALSYGFGQWERIAHILAMMENIDTQKREH